MVTSWLVFTLEREACDPDHATKIMTKAKRDTDVDASLRAACVEMG